jgi:hypothetical protein
MDKDSILEIAKKYTDAIRVEMPFEKALLFGLILPLSLNISTT